MHLLIYDMISYTNLCFGELQRARIEESGGSSSALKEYLGTHATLVDPGADTYSCTYPDTQTQEYCVSVMFLTN